MVLGKSNKPERQHLQMATAVGIVGVGHSLFECRVFFGQKQKEAQK